MLYLAILCIAMAVLSAVFWIVEIQPFALHIRYAAAGNVMAMPFHVVCALPKLIPFAIDISFTLWIVGQFGLGGVIGAAMGLSISNVISLFLIRWSHA